MRERLVAVLSSTFGVVAVVLACVGLYGVLAFAVTRRTQEIGIRMALGATRPAVIWLVLREAVVLAVAGIVAGFALAAKGFETVDGVAFGSAAAILLLCAGAAAIVPSRRISLLDPTQALRRE
jgi:ABC-type antimicrobial peptide transport system permease subunit